MSQKTNLNISPYYDDFNDDNNFYRVLFRPGRPVQARELTTLQSILQNQIQSFGSHVFKDGSMVLPGGVAYDDRYFSVRLESEHLGLPISLYLDNLKGKKLKGQNSGIELLVNDCKLPSSSDDITDVTIFVKYLTGNNDNLIANLEDGEPLLTLEDITYGNTTIVAGESVATLVPTNASAVGSAVKMNEGVYFIRGTFVSVPTSTIVLDAYSNEPSYRVGLRITESIITAKEDSSLYDNAKGFSNFAAPGADRFKISATLSKKSLSDTSDVNFVEVIKLRNGELKKLQDFSVYNELEKYLAARTFEESGNYSIDNFKVEVSDSLDDGLSNGGIFKSNQITEEGNTPSDDLGCLEVSSGKAYVQGFRISTPGTTIVDFEKPRDKGKVNTALVPFDMGTLIRVNNVSGTPVLGTGVSENTVSLLSRRKDSSVATGIPSGAYEIGKARVYSFGLRNTPYADNASQWNLHLFDVQTYTFITLNTSLTATISSFVRGASSGATGFINSSVSGATEIVLSQTSGTFIPNEQLIIDTSNGEQSRSIVSVRQYTFEDVKSVYQNTNGMTGGITGFIDFSADTILETTRIQSIPSFNNSVVSSTNGITGTITSPGNAFTGIKTESIIQYQTAGTSDINFNRVTDISTDLKTLTVAGITTVSGINDGKVGINTTSSVSLASPVVVDKENTGLYAKLGFDNICEVNLANATLAVSSQSAMFALSANSTIQAVPAGITSAFYSNFDTQKYSLVYSDGTVEPLTRDQFELVDAGSKVQFSGLSKNSGNAVLNVTVEKQSITNKTKQFVRSNKIVIDKTKVGVSTSTNGLTFNQYYGLRIEDREISLNAPDVVNVVSILESKNNNDPTLDKITTVSGLSLNTNAVDGEKIIGAESGAVAQLITRVDGENVEVAYFTDTQFVLGEIITFQESNIETTVQAITLGNNINVTQKYSLDKGQREQYYDYSRIVRKPTLSAPSRRLLVIFNSYIVPTTDTGDLFTVNSYDQERFTSDIPHLEDNLRATDTLDFRPRVSPTSSTSISPFAFTSRDFSVSGSTPSLVVSPEGDSRLGYSYFLPRIDKLVLSRGEAYEGSFAILKGVSSLNPKPPALIDGAMHLATIELPAYLYNSSDAKVTLIENRRYTMRDIGKLEDRIENLEIATSLSLLELDTKTLQIKDTTGDRFKSGFFVDDFKDVSRIDLENQDTKISIDTENDELISPLDQYSVKPLLGVSESIDINSADFSQNLPLLDSNVQKTGDFITLKYSEVKSDIGNDQASRVENINPYEVVVRQGRITLSPSEDNWTRVTEVDGGIRRLIGDNAGTFTDRILTSSIPDPFIRSRNVGFSALNLTPGVRHYPFFDGRSGIDIVPKLLEISMVSGTFGISETIRGISTDGNQILSFRVAQPNHKTGTYDSPSSVFPSNPYDTSLTLGSFYTESSTVLNVDIASLSQDAQGQFFGRVAPNMRLIGETTGAIAILSNIRLIPDEFGAVFGSFFFRDPTGSPPPPLRFSNGIKTFRLTSSVNNENPLPGQEGINITRGDARYSTIGLINQFTSTTTIVRLPPPPPPQPQVNVDPLAQSFIVDETGMFLSSLDLYFATKDDKIPVTVQVRTVELGTPTSQLVQDYAEVVLDPTQLDSSGESIIKTSTDASLPTRVTFPSPIYLEPDREYAIVLLAPATIEYNVWIAQMGEETIETQTLGVDEGSKSIVTKQYLGGSLFKSQNGTVWTATQTQDLKFNLYKCSFVTSPGTLTLFNSDITTSDLVNLRLQDNSFKTYPRKLKVGIDTTNALSSIISIGTKVSASNVSPYTNSTDAKGFVEKIGGPIVTSSVSTVGSGYSTGSFFNVSLYSLTGNGSGVTGTVVVGGSGAVSSVSIGSTGNGHVVGDVLGITTADMGNAGSGGEVTVTSIFGMDTLYLTNVQGEKINDGRKLVYYTDIVTETIANSTVDVRGDSVINGDLYSGNVLEVNTSNHSMNSIENVVQLDGIKPDTVPVLLTENISSTDTVISVANTAPFTKFEGITTSAGYVQIGKEIIFYNGIGSGNLTVGARGFGGSVQDAHFINDQAFKYEFNGISMTGINTTHNLPTNATLQSLKTSDTYFLEINRGAGRSNLLNRSTGVNQISFTDEKVGGENQSVGSQNFQYDAFVPSFSVMTPSTSTTISSQLRSVSGTSEGGSELSFVDQGFESVEFNQLNRLDTPRLLCSKVNENARLSGLPRNKSVTLLTQFNTTDPNLSPVLDTMNGAFRFLRNRLNSPISDYTVDSRSNNISGDPHSSCYISQKVNLQQASTSLKVLISAYRHPSADFRVLYRLFKTDSSEVEQSYELFPGFDNLNDVGIDKIVIDPKLNSGKPDVFIPASKEDEFRQYEFTVDGLDEFVGFQIKIVSSGTNEAYPPRYKDLRVIALA
tara:strand:- start:4059 stop:11225 length:7167 start_codon:yes stop_codon:yes gene_type:complete